MRYDNSYHRIIKMKPVDVESNTYIDCSKEINDKEINDKDRKFKIGDSVRILKRKNIFAKGYVPNWSEDLFVLQKLKRLFPGHMLLLILKDIMGAFYEKELQKTNQI